MLRTYAIWERKRSIGIGFIVMSVVRFRSFTAAQDTMRQAKDTLDFLAHSAHLSLR